MTAIDTPDWLPSALPGPGNLLNTNLPVNAGASSPLESVSVAGYEYVIVGYESTALTAVTWEFFFASSPAAVTQIGPPVVAYTNTNNATTIEHWMVLAVAGPNLIFQVSNTGAANTGAMVSVSGVQAGGKPSPLIPPGILASAGVAVAANGSAVIAVLPHIAGDAVLAGVASGGAWRMDLDVLVAGVQKGVATISNTGKGGVSSRVAVPPGDLQLLAVDLSGVAQTITGVLVSA